jgi:N-acyl homoserine lactone hydrolase
MNQFKVTALKIGNITNEKPQLTYMTGFGETVTVPVWVAAIEGNGIKALVDTGIRYPDKWDALNPCWAEKDETIEASLNEIGWRFKDIDFVINSHLHYDHAENNLLFKNARFIVSRAEWEYAKCPIPSQAKLYDFEWTDESINHMNYQLISVDDYDIMPGLRLIQTPGHTRGHQSILVNTAEGLLCVAGDAACLPENFSIPTSPAGATSIEQAFDSLERIRSSAEFVLMNHDPNVKKYQNSGFLKIPQAGKPLPAGLIGSLPHRNRS